MTKLSLGEDIRLEVTKLENGGIDILIDDFDAFDETESMASIQLSELETRELANFILLTIIL